MEINYDNSALNAISKKFNEGIQDVTPVTVIIISAVLLIIIFSVYLGIRNRRRTRKAAEASFQSLIRKFDLTILEIDLIEKLAATLRKPGDKYHLLKNKSTYRQALKKIEDLDEFEQKINSRLMMKLGFSSRESDPGSLSTASLPRDMPVCLQTSDGEVTDAEIYSVAETSLTVKCPDSAVAISTEEELLMFAPCSGRLCVFRLKPDKVRSELFSAPHSEAESDPGINTRIGITLTGITQDGEETIKSFIVHLSEKGIFVTDKKGELRPGDAVRLFFHKDYKKKYGIDAEVLKTSTEKNLAMIKIRDRSAE